VYKCHEKTTNLIIPIGWITSIRQCLPLLQQAAAASETQRTSKRSFFGILQFGTVRVRRSKQLVCSCGRLSQFIQSSHIPIVIVWSLKVVVGHFEIGGGPF
jgi:hypothetical protein